MKTKPTDLDRTEELYEFLQGTVPGGMRLDNIPSLSLDEAWTVIYVLTERFKGWLPKDTIERCDVCGDLYDTNSGGTCLDFGSEPNYFCEDCESGFEYQQKIREEADSMCYRAHRDKELRRCLLEFADTTEQDAEGLSLPQLMARLRLIVGETFSEESG